MSFVSVCFQPEFESFDYGSLQRSSASSVPFDCVDSDSLLKLVRDLRIDLAHLVRH